MPWVLTFELVKEIDEGCQSGVLALILSRHLIGQLVLLELYGVEGQLTQPVCDVSTALAAVNYD